MWKRLKERKLDRKSARKGRSEEKEGLECGGKCGAIAEEEEGEHTARSPDMSAR